MAAYVSSITIAAIFLFIAGVHTHTDNKRILLENEPTVDLGGELGKLQAQINAILGDNLALKQEVGQLKASKQSDDSAFKQEIEQLKQETEQLRTSKQNDTTALKQEIERLKATQQTIVQGSVFVRWGRNVCPSTSKLVYTGFTAGKHYNEGGSGTDNLCLPVDPTWSKYVDGGSGGYRAYICGTEIDTVDSDHIFNYPVHDQDLPCAVCRSTNPSTVMIPARNNCYAGWTMEYNGYLMAGYQAARGSYNHVCVDENPEFLQHGSTNDNQHILYLVEGKCGSLPCPPYVDGRELACVVCSK